MKETYAEHKKHLEQGTFVLTIARQKFSKKRLCISENLKVKDLGEKCLFNYKFFLQTKVLLVLSNTSAGNQEHHEGVM
jgi:hypothetical protein